MIWYLNGDYLPSEKAFIPVTDLGLNRGWAIFEYLRTYNKKPLLVEDHLDRFFKGCRSLYLKPKVSRRQLEELITDLIEKNKVSIKEELGVKIIFTAGLSVDGVTPSGQPNFLIMIIPSTLYPKELYKKGVSLLVVDKRRVFPEIKSINYLSAMVSLEEAEAKGFFDALFIGNKGEVLESTRSNFFAFIDNYLVTAKKDVLPGVTRKLVIKIAKANGLRVAEKEYYLKDLEKAQEAFITSSDKEIMPVVKISHILIGNGRVGQKTDFLMRQFKRYINCFV